MSTVSVIELAAVLTTTLDDVCTAAVAMTVLDDVTIGGSLGDELTDVDG